MSRSKPTNLAAKATASKNRAVPGAFCANFVLRFARASGVALSLSLALGAGVGCKGKFGPPKKGAAEAGETGEEEKATPIRVAKLGTGDIQARVSSASTIEAERQVTVHAEATGRLSRVAYEEGDKVKSGALLARVRRDAQASGLDRASANYQKAKADVERVERLAARGVSSQEELANAKATLRAASIDKRDRRRDLSNTNIAAPFGGTVTERFINEGSFVNAGQQVYAITDFTSLVARVYVPEKELDRIKVGQSADIVGKAAAGRTGIGTVMRIAPIVDATTGTVKVTIALPPALAGGEQGFLPGMYAEVTLTTDTREGVVLVPKNALIYEEERVFAFTTDGDRAKRVLVEIGLSDDEQVELVKGLEAGDEIIIAGQNGLEDGALVEVVSAADDGSVESMGKDKANKPGADKATAEEPVADKTAADKPDAETKEPKAG